MENIMMFKFLVYERPMSSVLVLLSLKCILYINPLVEYSRALCMQIWISRKEMELNKEV